MPLGWVHCAISKGRPDLTVARIVSQDVLFNNSINLAMANTVSFMMPPGPER